MATGGRGVTPFSTLLACHIAENCSPSIWAVFVIRERYRCRGMAETWCAGRAHRNALRGWQQANWSRDGWTRASCRRPCVSMTMSLHGLFWCRREGQHVDHLSRRRIWRRRSAPSCVNTGRQRWRGVSPAIAPVAGSSRYARRRHKTRFGERDRCFSGRSLHRLVVTHCRRLAPARLLDAHHGAGSAERAHRSAVESLGARRRSAAGFESVVIMKLCRTRRTAATIERGAAAPEQR